MDKRIKKSLYNFQYKTVRRVCDRFQKGHNRILVADEVGLGKTIIAKGVISELAEQFFSYKSNGKLINKNKVFRVVYICSNQVIARQNIRKLDLDGTWEKNNHSDTRLSMQTLKLWEDEKSKAYKGKIQLIPLTPYTSFSLSHSYGIKEERAFIYTIMSKILDNKCFNYLKTSSVTEKSWNDVLVQMNNRVEHQGKAFFDDLQERINTYFDQNVQILKDINGNKKTLNERIQLLRRMFAAISVDRLNPNLVIMDEFQRYKDLIDSSNSIDNQDEVSMLTHQFFNKQDLQILLLSATPYKSYSTKSEIIMGESNHKAEFDSVIKFLQNNENRKFENFKQKWDVYSKLIENPKQRDNWDVIVSAAESSLYESICRTERNSIMDNNSFIKENCNQQLEINYNDIKSYLEMGNLLKKMNLQEQLPVDYSKSCPFLMSFMINYEIKKKIKKEYEKIRTFPPLQDQDTLWINGKDIEEFNELPITNAKVKAIKNAIFNESSHIENLLWIPPSKPYYILQNAYGFCNESQYKENPLSKVIVFSAWKMVPRMLSTLLSYEVEKRTYKNTTRDIYSKKYEPKFLDFVELTKQNRYYLYSFLYPSKTLARLYNPLEFYGESLDKIKPLLMNRIKHLINKSGFKISKDGKGNSIYYSLLPMYWDNDFHTISSTDTFYNKWQQSLDNYKKDDLFIKHKNDVDLEFINNLKNEELPSDIIEVLTNMTLAAPATCIYRNLKRTFNDSQEEQNVLAYITDLANHFCRIFNSTESVSAIRNVYKSKEKSEDDDEKSNFNPFWKDVLVYCVDGCFQSMFDEYYDTVSSAGLGQIKILNTMMESIVSVNATYVVDTYENFTNLNKSKDTELRMRTHFAVSFVKGKEDESSADRKEKVRNAFNAPIRPFVLTTTSIGQEGLDFHNYCRKIVHWNLPNNAIDLEQREGRINRYKCLAIRQSLVSNFNIEKDEKGFIWDLLYSKAEKTRPIGKSELYPYWCLGNKETIKIERIVFQYPLSLDQPSYKALKDVLLNYRLTLGQPNQEDLINFLKEQNLTEEEKKQLCINLSPFDK